MDFEDLIKVGNKIQKFYNENNINNCVIEIRAIVDEEYVVFKRYYLKKESAYIIESIHHFKMLYENNILKLI